MCRLRIAYTVKTHGIRSQLTDKKLLFLHKLRIYLLDFFLYGLQIGLLLTFLKNKKIQNQCNRKKKYSSCKKNTA